MGEDVYKRQMYMAPRNVIEKVDTLFASLHFERIRITDDGIAGTPAEAEALVKERIRAETQESERAAKELSEIAARERERPVSYTHLDVYKRQDLHRAVRAHFVAAVAADAGFADDLRAVVGYFDGVLRTAARAYTAADAAGGVDPRRRDEPFACERLQVVRQAPDERTCRVRPLRKEERLGERRERVACDRHAVRLKKPERLGAHERGDILHAQADKA